MNRLEQFRIIKLPPSVYYIPDFLSPEEEEYLIAQVNSAPKPKWTQLSNRRLQNWGGLPHPKGMIAEKIPEWLDKVAKKIEAYEVFEGNFLNHVLVNEYQPGQGIMPHEDGPLYYPTVSNVTLGSHGVLDFYKPIQSATNEPTNSLADSDTILKEKCDSSTSYKDRYLGSMLLERRSLFLMREDMYQTYLHGIEERKTDIMNDSILNLDRCKVIEGEVLERTTRVSLTIRVVLKVLKNKIFFGAKK